MRRRINLKLSRLVSAIIIPILLLPLALHEKTTLRCLYVLLLMGFFWVFSLTPESITALLPLSLFPLLNILSTKEICVLYADQSVMMMLSSLILACAIKESNFHTRVAFKMLTHIGTSIHKVLFGLMLCTCVLSFCISNSAATAMLMPVTDAIVNELNQQFNKNEKQNKYFRKDLTGNFASRSPNRSPKSVFRYDFSNSNQNSMSNSLNSVETGMQLAVVLTGSSNRLSSRTSTEFKSIIIDEDNQFEENIRRTVTPKSMNKSQRSIKLAFFFSLAYAANIGGTVNLTANNPNLILQAITEKTYPESSELSLGTWLIYALPTALIMLILSWIFVLTYFLRDVRTKSINQTRNLEECLISRYETLGPITFHEFGCFIFFVLIVFSWFFRSPGFMRGWQDHLKFENQMINDATPAFLLLILMSLIPADLRQFKDDRKTNHRFRPKHARFLLNWNSVIKKLQWSVILLFGGGLALAESTQKSELTDLFTNLLIKMNIKYPKIFIACLTIFCASPCSALVFQHLGIDILNKLLPGAIMNLICGIVEFIFIITYGRLVFNTGATKYLNSSNHLNRMNQTRIF